MNEMKSHIKAIENNCLAIRKNQESNKIALQYVDNNALNKIECDETTYVNMISNINVMLNEINCKSNQFQNNDKINNQNMMLEKQHNQMEALMCQLKDVIENSNKQISEFQSLKLKVDDSSS